jgi:hypothetical protein
MSLESRQPPLGFFDPLGLVADGDQEKLLRSPSRSRDQAQTHLHAWCCWIPCQQGWNLPASWETSRPTEPRSPTLAQAGGTPPLWSRLPVPSRSLPSAVLWSLLDGSRMKVPSLVTSLPPHSRLAELVPTIRRPRKTIVPRN